MGNREDLLAGAVRSLLTKGYARTTARDVAAAAGVSLAAIGYHYGSKEALLHAALIRAVEEWGAELERTLAADGAPQADPVERFEVVWERVVGLFTAHQRLWAVNFEILAHVEEAPELRRALAEALERARLGLVELFGGVEGVDEPGRRAVGSFYHALLLGVMTQWLIDPESAPSGRDLAVALRVAAGLPR